MSNVLLVHAAGGPLGVILPRPPCSLTQSLFPFVRLQIGHRPIQTLRRSPRRIQQTSTMFREKEGSR